MKSQKQKLCQIPSTYIVTGSVSYRDYLDALADNKKHWESKFLSLSMAFFVRIVQFCSQRCKAEEQSVTSMWENVEYAFVFSNFTFL